MSPAMSNVPAVDNDLFFVSANTALMPANLDALAEVSCAFDCASSPSDADNIAPTSAADLSITDIFKSLKFWIWSVAEDNAFSRDCTSLNFDEQIQRRYWSFAVPQN